MTITKPEKIDTTVITGTRTKRWAGPIRQNQPDGYHCDANFFNGKGYVWFAVNGKAVLVAERVLELMASDLQRVKQVGLGAAIKYFQAVHREETGRRDVDEIKREQNEADLDERYAYPDADVAGVPFTEPVEDPWKDEDFVEVVDPKNLAHALETDYPDFENALRTPTMGHKAVAEAFPFTSETSVRRWRKANEVEVAK